MKTKLVIVTVLLTLFSIVTYLSLDSQFVPVKAPDVLFTTIKGQKIELKQLKGKPVIISFWATDCANCIEEVPLLIRLYQNYHKQGLEIIAVNMYYDPPNHIVQMTKVLQIPYHVALDLRAEHAHAFGKVQLTPNSFLISPEGEIIWQKTGKFDFADLSQKIKTLIAG